MPSKWQRLTTGAHEGRENIPSPNWTTTSSETQGRSVRSGITVPEVFKDGWESLWGATLKKPVPRLIRCLSVIFCALRCEQRFLSRMAFSIYEVIRVACVSHSWFVYAPWVKAMQKRNLCSHGICAQSVASIYRAAFLIFLSEGAYLQTRLWITLSTFQTTGARCSKDG